VYLAFRHQNQWIFRYVQTLLPHRGLFGEREKLAFLLGLALEVLAAGWSTEERASTTGASLVPDITMIVRSRHIYRISELTSSFEVSDNWVNGQKLQASPFTTPCPYSVSV